MSDILFMCYTDMQILAAIQMKLTFFSKDEVDLIIFDHFKNAKMLYRNLSALNLFRKGIYYQTNIHDYLQSKRKDVLDIVQFPFMDKKGKLLSMGLSKKYDEIVFHNFTYFLYVIFFYYFRTYPETKFSCMEEGILSYNQALDVGKRVKILNGLSGRGHDIFAKIDKYYCFCPAFKKKWKEREIVKIPAVKTTRETFLNIVNQIYEYKPLDIQESFIFFGNSMCVDGTCKQEPDVIKKIADYVGKENLIVKVHPREDREIYQKIGVKMMENASLPWEVYYLNGHFEAKIFLSTVSNAFLNAFMLKEEDAKGIFLFPLIEKNDYIKNRGEEITDMLNALHTVGIMKNCRVGKLEDLNDQSGNDTNQSGHK